jgi:hypothetical protein
MRGTHKLVKQCRTEEVGWPNNPKQYRRHAHFLHTVARMRISNYMLWQITYIDESGIGPLPY